MCRSVLWSAALFGFVILSFFFKRLIWRLWKEYWRSELWVSPLGKGTAVGLWAPLCVSAAVEGWSARAGSLFSRDRGSWKSRGGRSGGPIWVRGGCCCWRQRPAERRVRGWSVHGGWERGRSELGNGWPRKRACLWKPAMGLLGRLGEKNRAAVSWRREAVAEGRRSWRRRWFLVGKNGGKSVEREASREGWWRL